jgi:hypothetical protein
VSDCYTHEINKLILAADLKPDLDAATAANTQLSANWGVVKDWNEGSRYEQFDEAKARGLYDAITNDPDGVILWIRARW